MRRWLLIGVGVPVAIPALVYLALLIFSRDQCTVGKPSCPRGSICTRGSLPPDKIARCVQEQPASGGIYRLPVRGTEGTICTQSTQNPDGSHGYQNTLFALDLTSPLNGPAAVMPEHRFWCAT